MTNDDLLGRVRTQLHQYDRGELLPSIDKQKLKDRLALRLNAPITIVPEEEYVYADQLIIQFTESAKAINESEVPTPGNVIYAAHVWISDVSPFATVEWRTTSDAIEWQSRVDSSELPPALQAVDRKLQEALKDEGLEVLSGSVLDILLPGRTSELDDSDATVFQALFSELP
jgi:hypothetical protein